MNLDTGDIASPPVAENGGARLDAAAHVAGGALPGTVLKPGGTSRTWLILCLAFVAVRLPFMFTVPMAEAPDEFAHYWVIKFLLEHRRLPNAAEVAAGGPSAVYGSLPQFGYIPHVLISAFMPHNALPLFERFGSLFGGLVLLYAAYHVAAELFPRNQTARLALPAVLIFHPQLAFLHGYANCDSTSTALSGILLLLTLRSIRSGICLKRCLLIGLLGGWLALSKYAGLSIMPVVAFGLVAAAVINRTPLLKATGAALACFCVFASVCGWWFWRNFHEFGGDILGTQTMYKSWALTFHKDLHYHLPASHIIKELRWWRMMYYSYWAMFGYMTRYLWRPVYLGWVGFLLLAAWGWGKEVLRLVQANWDAGAARSAASWGCVVVSVVLNLAAMIWASTGNLGGPQGRYLMTSEIPVMGLFIAGLAAAGGRRAVLCFLLFNVAACVGSWIMLFSLYGVHASPL